MDLGQTMLSLSVCAWRCPAALVYDKETVVLSILGTYFNGIILDHFIFDHNKKRRVCIITEKEEALRQFIINELHSGAHDLRGHRRVQPAEAQRDHHHRRQSEYQRLMAFINREDPKGVHYGL